ncbi:MAG: glycosyltransferase family 4 protein [Candidatus Berkiella sp.]
MKKKIGLYLDAGPACGGTYQYNHLMLEALIELPTSDYNKVVFYGAKHWEPLLNSYGIKSQWVPVPKHWRILAGLLRRLKLPLGLWHKIAGQFHPLAKAMLKEKADAWIFPSQDAYAYLMPVPAIAAVHDLMHRYESRFPEVGNKQEYKRREYHYQNTCKWAKGILVDSLLGREQAVASYQIEPDRCHVLPYIANRYIESISPSDDFSKKYRLPSKYLFYPAQFWQHKNHDNLLKAIALCKQEIPEIQLVLVGSPKNHFEAVMHLIQTFDLESSVHILGLVDEQDMPELFRRARALVMPTFFGPTNIPPLEAFALGCPVAISDIYGMKAQLAEAALYFDPLSPESIAVQVRRLWQDDALCQELKAKGKQWRANYQFTHFYATLANIIREVVHGQPKTV